MLRDGMWEGAVKGWENKENETLQLGCPSLRLPWLWMRPLQGMGISEFQAAADGSFCVSVQVPRSKLGHTLPQSLPVCILLLSFTLILWFGYTTFPFHVNHM